MAEIKVALKVDSSQAVKGTKQLDKELQGLKATVDKNIKTSAQFSKTTEQQSDKTKKSSQTIKEEAQTLDTVASSAKKATLEVDKLNKKREEASKFKSDKSDSSSTKKVLQDIDQVLKRHAKVIEENQKLAIKADESNEKTSAFLDTLKIKLDLIAKSEKQLLNTYSKLAKIESQDKKANQKLLFEKEKHLAQQELLNAKREKELLALQEKKIRLAEIKQRNAQKAEMRAIKANIAKSATGSPDASAGAFGSPFGGVATVLAGGALTSQVFEAAQSFQMLANKLTLVKQPGEDAKQTLDDLFVVANESKQPVEAVAEAYSTLKKNTTQLGLSQEDLLKLTTTISKSIAIGGSTAQQAANSMVQFGQALTMGKLSGQNLNSVMEQTPGLLEAIAVGLGMNSAELKVYANEGKLTTEQIVQALNSSAESVGQKFGNITVTVDGALNTVKNNFLKFIGETDFFSDKIARALIFVSEHFQLMGVAVGVAAIALVGLKGSQVISYLEAVGNATNTANFSFKKLWATIKGVNLEMVKHATRTGASAIATRGLAVGIGIAKTAWMAFNQVFKTTVVGLVLVGIGWAISKVASALSEMFSETLSYTDKAKKNIEGLKGEAKDQIQQLDEIIAKRNAETEQLKQQIKLLEAKREADRQAERRYDVVNDTESMFTGGSSAYHATMAKADDQIAKLNSRIKENQATVEVATKRQSELETQIKQTAESTKVLNATMGKAKEISFFEKQSKANAQQLVLFSRSLDRLNAGYTASGNAVQQFYDKVAAGSDGYNQLSQSQISILAQQIQKLEEKRELIKATENYQEQSKGYAEKIAMMEYELTLHDLEKEKRLELLEIKKQELDIQKAELGMTEEQREALEEQRERISTLQEQLKEQHEQEMQAQQEKMDSFSYMLAESSPKIKDFRKLGVNAFNKIGDAIGKMAVGGKVSWEEMGKTIVQEFVSMAAKVALLSTAIFIGDKLTAGGLSAFLGIASAGLKGGGGGRGSGFTGIVSSLLGFSSGGYTGNAPKDQVAGVVHGREYVINAASTALYGHKMLSDINQGKYNPSEHAEATSRSSAPIINIYNNAANVDVKASGSDGVINIEVTRRLAREEALRVYEEAERG